MIEETISDLFGQLDHTVKIVYASGEKDEVFPSAEHIRTLLDTAAEALYTEPIGARMNIASLIVEKRRGNKFDVYKYVGEYN